ncbi:hypothetical protein [Pedosphaera parvula]|uniref:Uncharacterized protein n=1 Tax=Pedosphaera parvula (strain Ellin514) TaxID=320771 RepID=B9XHW8_PEDPL|nr:hypothetical protein [Pedosphaera parvula]EEF60461.1 hypothetical protein Cflav_PD3431 [Pedosphaera parvula Ellin514]
MNSTTITNATNGSIVHITRISSGQVRHFSANPALWIALGIVAVLVISLGLYLIFRKEKIKS